MFVYKREAKTHYSQNTPPHPLIHESLGDVPFLTLLRVVRVCECGCMFSASCAPATGHETWHTVVLVLARSYFRVHAGLVLQQTDGPTESGSRYAIDQQCTVYTHEA